MFRLILGIWPTWGMTPCRMLLSNTYATTRSDLTSLTVLIAVCYRKGSPKHAHRYIHAAPTRPPRARRLGHTYPSRLTVRNRPPPPAARPPRTKHGGRHLLRLLLEESRQPAYDPLLLLGPNGGPLWTSRTQ